MIIAGITLLSIAGLVLLIFLVCVIRHVLWGGNTFGICVSAGVKVNLPILIIFLVCVVAGVLMIVLNK